MSNHVAPYEYLLPHMYLFMADIANPDLCVCVCRTWIRLDITRINEEQHHPPSGSAWRAGPKTVKLGPPLLEREDSIQYSQQLVTAVTAPPLVGCVVWSHKMILFKIIHIFFKGHSHMYIMPSILHSDPVEIIIIIENISGILSFIIGIRMCSCIIRFHLSGAVCLLENGVQYQTNTYI